MLSRSMLVGCALLSGLLGGCSWFNNKASDYRSQGGKIPSLEVPPDLTSPVADDRFLIPDSKGTTFSTYSREKGVVPATTSGVLPKVENARMERNGDQRWLVVKATPDKVWLATKEFWLESGFALKRELPEAGIMETDWAENRTKIPQDFIRNTVGRFLDGLYDSGQRDKFRTRLESGIEAGTTEVYISHRGAEEIYSNTDKNSTAWQVRPADKELEAEMLSRLMVKIGFVAPADKVAATMGTGLVDNTPAKATFDKVKGGLLKVNEPFDRAWRRVGLALDRIGFTVEDRDRSKGLFFVRYIDPEADAKSGGQKSWFEKLAFWRSDDPMARPLYRVSVVDKAGVSDVEVQNSEGKREESATSKRILGLLLDQLK